MKSSERTISFLLDKNEIKLLREVCLFVPDAERNLDDAVPEKVKYRVSFSYNELDEFNGFVAAVANHETSRRKQQRFHDLFEKLDTLLRLSSHLKSGNFDYLIKRKKPSLKYLTFEVCVHTRQGKKSARTIQIAETRSLYNFAKTIIKSFDFYFDHCFGFYERRKGHFFEGRAFELFVDIGEEPTIKGAKGVKRVKIQQAFKSPGDKMFFLFDYGDSWQFDVELKQIIQDERRKLEAKVLAKSGDVLVQYPPCEDRC